MRTVDLIHLLRSRERNSPQAETELASLHPTRRRHLLGETSNWLRAEIQKYQDRQERSQAGNNSRGGGAGTETEQQAEIKAQIKKTLQAIQVILDYSNHGQQQPRPPQLNSISSGSGGTSGSLPESETNPQALVLSDRAEERILDSLLTALLIGILPLGGPQTDSTDIQCMCAKILYYCLCPPSASSSLGNHGDSSPLFPPLQAAKRMMELTRKGRNQSSRVDKDRTHIGSETSVDAIKGLVALLQSPLMKLRDYGLRIIASHRILISYDESWALLAPISSIIQSLATNLEGIATSSHAAAASSGQTTNQDNGGTSGIVGQELENEIGVHFKALVLLQCFLQEAGKYIGGPPQSMMPSSSIRVGSTKWKQLRSASSIPLMFGLWREIQLIAIVYKVDFKGRDKIILQSMAVVYWILWVFQEEAMAYMLAEGADTLMAWYGYFIVSRDLSPQTPLDGTSEDHRIMSDHPLQRAPLIEDDIKHQSAVLEYLSKIIQTIVTSKKNHPTLFSGKRPVGIIAIRRTIEFLENILESTLPVTVENTGFEIPYTMDSPPEETPRHLSFSVRIIQQKPGVLEAMLAILLGSFNVTREGDDLILHTGLTNLLVLIISGIQPLFGIQTLSATMDSRVQLLTLNFLLQILRRDLVPGLEDIPKNHWDLAYPALVDRIMVPLENEAETILAGGAVDPGLANLEIKMTQEQDIGTKALRLFLLLWRHKPRSRSDLSELLGPRLFQLRLLLVLGVNKAANWTPPRSQWVQDRALLVLKTIVCFSSEASVRINMRERWSSLQFLSILITVNVGRLVGGGLLSEDPSLVAFVRAVVLKSLVGLKSFWFDQMGLTRMMDMELSRSDENTRVLDRLPTIDLLTKINPPSDGQRISLVPVLLSILAPPKIQWTSDLMLKMEGRCSSKMAHPLFENNDPILVEAALVLCQLAQFVECQQFLMSRPGAIWILSRMMVERTLVGTSALREDQEENDKPDGNGDELEPDEDTPQIPPETSTAISGVAATLAKEETTPRLLLERVLFDTLTRVFSSMDMAKTLVSNNTTTELFAAILEMDRPLCFYESKLGLEVTFDTVQSPPKDEILDQEAVQILPVPRQHALHQQLLYHFREVLSRSKNRFEGIFKYVGGHRSLQQDADDSEETMYWLREFGALVFLYLSSSEEMTAALSKVDKTALLSSESVFGVVCRMLTLEIQYEDDSEDPPPVQPTLDHEQDIVMEDTIENQATVKKEEAFLRRFSAGLAIQSLCWRHMEQWRQEHFALWRSYDSVLTSEWEFHAATLKGAETGVVTQSTSPLRPASFLVQGRVITFENRALLVRASDYFQALLQGEFMETSMDQIPLGDLDPDDFELLLDVIRESEMTALHLLPEDLSFAVVLRLLVCADRFLVGFIKRLAGKWILTALGKKELKDYRNENPQSSLENQRDQIPDDSAHGLKHGRDSSPGLPPKRTKIDHIPGAFVLSSLNRDFEGATKEGRFADLQGKNNNNTQDEEESLQDCLLMIYETCSHPRFGDLHFRGHPFYGLVWDALKRMALRLQTVAIIPRFATLMDQGEDKIQEFLQILHELVENSIP